MNAVVLDLLSGHPATATTCIPTQRRSQEQGSEVQESPFLYTRVEGESGQVPKSNWEQVMNAYVGQCPSLEVLELGKGLPRGDL